MDDEAIEAIDKAIANETAQLSQRPTTGRLQATEGNEVERLIATGDKMLQAKQAQLIEAQAAYEKARAEKLSWCQSQMQILSDRTEHELLILDRAHDESCRQLAIVINKLKAMRAA